MPLIAFPFQATFPKFENGSEILAKCHEFDAKELYTGAHKELLNKYLSKDAPLRSLFNHNEDHIILFLKEINKKMQQQGASLSYELYAAFFRI